MAGRGGGGWRGGRSNHQYARPVPFVLFPEDINLPDVKSNEIDGYMKKLLRWDYQFNTYYKASSYYLEEPESKDRKRMHVETYSDKKKKVTFARDPLSQVLYYDGFAKELVPGQKMRRIQKKTRWNPEADMTQKAFFDELEKKLKKEEGKNIKEEKESEESEDDDEEEVESDGDFNDGDYNQNADFDDDEDDYNDVEPGHDEDLM